MADIASSLADMIRQASFYSAGGKDPGYTNADRFNQGVQLVGNVGDIINKALATKKAMLENQKLAGEETPIGSYFNIPSAKAEAAQNVSIAGKNSTQVPQNIYPQQSAELENAIPNTSNGPTQIIPTPSPMLNARETFQNKYKMSPDTPISDTGAVMKVAAMDSGKPMFISPKGDNISFDPTTLLQGYKLFENVPGKQAATIAASNANATRPTPIMTTDQGLAATAAGNAPGKNTRLVQSGQTGLDSRADALANAIISGGIPPDVTKLAGGRGGLGSMVLQRLSEKGFDYKNANLNWQQAVAGNVGLSRALNSTQMVQLQTAFNTVKQDIQPMRDISAELDRVGFNPANRLVIKARLNGVELDPSSTSGMNGDQVQVATKYITQINLMRDNMAVAFMRGGVPTDQAFKLTEQILSPVYSNPQINSALDQVERNLQYRENALGDVGVRVPGQHPANNAPATSTGKTKSGMGYRVIP